MSSPKQQAAATKQHEQRIVCPHCNVGLRGVGVHAHVTRCKDKTPEERAYYKTHRAWPSAKWQAKILGRRVE